MVPYRDTTTSSSTATATKSSTTTTTATSTTTVQQASAKTTTSLSSSSAAAAAEAALTRPHLSQRKTSPDPSRLAPEDALTFSQIRLAAQGHDGYRRSVTESCGGSGSGGSSGGGATTGSGLAARLGSDTRRKRDKAGWEGSGGGAGSVRRRRVWKKLLWVKQSYPDNYTDEVTFLDHLQRNPRLQPYEFWPLMEGLTVIVQHVCSVIIFVCCFVAIFQDRICPMVIVSMASVATVTGWVLWNIWVSDDECGRADGQNGHDADREDELSSSSASSASTLGFNKRGGDIGRSAGEMASARVSQDSSTTGGAPEHCPEKRKPLTQSCNEEKLSDPDLSLSRYPDGSGLDISPKNMRRLATIKSAILIYCAVLGLSPILKSLTRSTSSDSIWAMSCWLIIINVFFFHYDASPTSKAALPGSHANPSGNPNFRMTASLSTNAALMASTLLASRLPSTTHVFSLTLFSIEMFALFPIFRRLLRLVSWQGHMVLTVLLVLGAGGGLNMAIIGPGAGWKAAVVGMVLGSTIIGLAMGLCSWWLIGLQKYKNEIYGPWDPARPVIRVRLD